MIELLIGLGVIGAAWALWPKGAKHQSVTSTDPKTGRKVTVAVPVSSSLPSAEQASPGTTIPSSSPPRSALPQPSPSGVGVNYAPAPVIVKDARPGVLTLAPMIITPTGAASLSISTVQDVQNGLNTLGYADPPLTVDGVAGPKTTAIVKVFQAKHGLNVNGVIDADLKAAIVQAIAALGAVHADTASQPAVVTAAPPVSPVETGAAPTSIDLIARLANATASNRDVQTALNMAGASPPLATDGAMGPKSVAAVKAFQLQNGLTVDGIAGPKTKAALAHKLGG